MNALRTTAALAIIACLGIVSARAQDSAPKVGERIGDWVFQCQALSATNTVCGLIQNIADRGTQRQVLSVAVRPIGQEDRLAMIVTAPLGIFLGSGIGGKIDEGKQFAFNLQSCTQRGCQGALELKDQLLDDLKKGDRLIVGYKARPDTQTIAIPVSLKGFTAGLEAIQKK